MTNETYNGWTNRETWLVNLWLTNDEDTYNECRGMDRDQLETFVDDMSETMPANVDGFFMDLINAAKARVNWQEIAESVAAD